MVTSKDILDQANQSIEANNSDHPTGTLTTTLQKPVGEQIYMSGLDTSHWKCTNIPKDKFQDQLTLLQ